MLDRALAERLALLLAGGPGPTGLPPADLIGLCADARDRVVAATGMVPEAELPAPEWVDRAGWSRANVATLAGLLDPLAERLADGFGSFTGPARVAAGAIAGAEAGALLGLVGRRVLGQYDLMLLDATVPPRLLFVGPNLREASHALDATEAALLRWVALHEVTHAVQFSAVPWLRDHLAGLLRELLDGIDVNLDLSQLLRLPSPDDLRAWAESVREGGLAAAVAGAPRRALLERVQATMALVEGHAEWVMDAAAEGLVDDLPRLRERLNRRRAERPPLLKLLDRLLGLDLKLRQYEDGRRFCDAVVAARGPDALRAAWRSPAEAPTGPELREPQAWLARVA